MPKMKELTASHINAIIAAIEIVKSQEDSLKFKFSTNKNKDEFPRLLDSIERCGKIREGLESVLYNFSK